MTVTHVKKSLCSTAHEGDGLSRPSIDNLFWNSKPRKIWAVHKTRRYPVADDTAVRIPLIHQSAFNHFEDWGWRRRTNSYDSGTYQNSTASGPSWPGSGRRRETSQSSREAIGPLRLGDLMRGGPSFCLGKTFKQCASPKKVQRNSEGRVFFYCELKKLFSTWYSICFLKKILLILLGTWTQLLLAF